MTATGRWYLNFWIWSVHVSTGIEVDTMVLKILDLGKMTSPSAYTHHPPGAGKWKIWVQQSRHKSSSGGIPHTQRNGATLI
jgi:hypothetical protein